MAVSAAPSTTVDLTDDESAVGLLIAKTDATNSEGRKGHCLALLISSSGQLLRPLAREGLAAPFWSHDRATQGMESNVRTLLEQLG